MNTLPVSQLRVWPGNPRKTVNEEALEELAVSIRDLGIQQPVVVRALPSPIGEVTHEVIDGQRRYLAAQRAQLHELPALVRDIDDVQALEIALAANTARAEAEPLEEAEALEALVKQGRAPHKIAERLGRSAQWVERRRKLLKLSEEARAFAREKKLSFAHMLALAFVDASVQQEVVQQFARTDPAYIPAAVPFARQVSYKLRRIENAPFDPKDATLGGEGACGTCLYRSDKQGDLFGDVSEDAACLRSECWNAKTEANWQRTVKDAKKRKLKVIESTGENAFDESLYTDDVPDDCELQPIAVTRSINGFVTKLYDVQAAKAAWHSLREAREKRSTRDEDEESEPSQERQPKKNRNDAYAEDQAKRRAKLFDRLQRVAKLLEEVDGLERLALWALQDEPVPAEVLQAAGVAPVLGLNGVEAHQAIAVLTLSMAFLRIENAEYEEEIEKEITALLGEEPPKEDPVPKIVLAIEESKSARSLGDAWQFAVKSAEHHDITTEQLAELNTAWKSKAERLGLSAATLKKMADEGKGPAIEKPKKEKRAKRQKTAEATP